MVATRCPDFISATATCMAVVDLPEPPFSLPSTMTCADCADPTGAWCNITHTLDFLILRVELCRRQDKQCTLRRFSSPRVAFTCAEPISGGDGGVMPGHGVTTELKQSKSPQFAPEVLRHLGRAGRCVLEVLRRILDG